MPETSEGQSRLLPRPYPRRITYGPPLPPGGGPFYVRVCRIGKPSRSSLMVGRERVTAVARWDRAAVVTDNAQTVTA